MDSLGKLDTVDDVVKVEPGLEQPNLYSLISLTSRGVSVFPVTTEGTITQAERNSTIPHLLMWCKVSSVLDRNNPTRQFLQEVFVLPIPLIPDGSKLVLPQP